MQNIYDLTYNELVNYFCETLQEPSFRATQVWQWLYQKLSPGFDIMSDLKVKTRSALKNTFVIKLPKFVDAHRSSDGTKKILLALEDQSLIETVLIPTSDHNGKIRYAQCLSTQVGCPMACTFCATGTLGFKRNLTHAEILGQVIIGKIFLHDIRPDRPVIKNLVFMGMGEPLLNLPNLLRSLESLNHPQGLAFTPRRITVSTCGIPKALDKLGSCGLCYLAVSLHAPNQALRSKLMPKAANFSLDDLLSDLKKYPLKPREFITFEYVLLKDINSSKSHALELAKILSQVKGKLNLIVYNPTPGLPYSAPSKEEILAFEQVLWSKNITAIVRQSKGQDIAAACGQLVAQKKST